MLRVEIVRSGSDLDKLRPVWESLWSQTPGLTIFQSFIWNRVAASCFSRREHPFVVHVENSNGAALLPAAVNCPERQASLLGEKLFDYGDFLQAGGCGPGGDGGLIDAGWQGLASLGLDFELEAIRADSPHYPWWASKIMAPFSASPMVERFNADDFRRQHARSARLLRRLERAGASLHQSSGKNAELLRCIYSRKAEQPSYPPNIFSDPLRRRFMFAMAQMRPQDFEIFILETASALVAAIVTLRDRDVRRFYTTYFDAAWAAMSPGAALLFEVTRLSLEDGLTCDYMTGEQPFKLRLATGSVPLYRVYVPAIKFAEPPARLQAA